MSLVNGSAGLLLERDDRPVKLHATLMNTRLRRTPKDAAGATPPAPARESFDARRVLEDHRRLDCGEHHLESVHLSKRGEFDVSLGGFYRCIASCPLRA